MFNYEGKGLPVLRISPNDKMALIFLIIIKERLRLESNPQFESKMKVVPGSENRGLWQSQAETPEPVLVTKNAEEIIGPVIRSK